MMKMPERLLRQEKRDRRSMGVKTLTRRRITYMLRRLALDHTIEGTLEEFSTKTGIHQTSLSRFMREARIPQRAAEVIEQVCGRDAITKEQLMYPMEYQNEEKDDL
jgi:hypothetical protein